jgi:Zn-dependent protease
MINLYFEIFIFAVVSLTAHELGHAVACHYLGDPSARLYGRLSLNPLRHASIAGTVIIPLAALFISSGHFIFGWAKPVPVARDNFINSLRDMSIVALAGPAVNVIFAIISLMLGLMATPGSIPSTVLLVVFKMNVSLAVFNMIPIPPLDGSHVARYWWSRVKRKFRKDAA